MFSLGLFGFDHVSIDYLFLCLCGFDFQLAVHSGALELF